MLSVKQSEEILQSAIDNNQQALADLSQAGWHLDVMENPCGIALFKCNKDGTPKKTPSIFMRYIGSPWSPWGVTVSGSSREFQTAKIAFSVMVELADCYLKTGRETAITGLNYWALRHNRSLKDSTAEKTNRYFYVSLNLLLEYSGANDEYSSRSVSVTEVHCENGNYYLRGLCSVANSVCVFKTSRVLHCIDTNSGEEISDLIKLLQDSEIKNKPYTGETPWW